MAKGRTWTDVPETSQTALPYRLVLLVAGSAVGKDRPLSQKQDLLLEDDCLLQSSDALKLAEGR